MCDVVTEEIMKIADKGLTTGNLETAYKLIDMLKDLKTVEAMEGGGGYSQRYDYDNSYGGYAMARDMRPERYVKGRYSRDDRSGADMASKLNDMMRDASPEDGRVLERLAGRIANL